MMPWETKYETVEQCDEALETILYGLAFFTVDGKAVILPGLDNILSIYSQAKVLPMKIVRRHAN